MELFSAPWWSALLAIVLIDLVLAGDNAIVIALAAQGTVIHREGRVHVDVVDGEVWVGGDTRTIFTGHLPEPKRPETDQ